jgi:glycosyltransferase involved in cell wall biosynthesis
MSMNREILFVGNFLSQTTQIRFVCEDLAERFTHANWSVIKTSHKPQRLARLLDMVLTIWRQRLAYRVALVEVYSGLSFWWAEIAALTLKILGKPYVLALHGGNLPAFSRRWPSRVRRLLKGAAAVTTPSLYLQSNLRIFRDDIKYLPNGMNIAHYNYQPRTRAAPRLCWLRRLHHIYNPLLAIKMLGLLVADFPEIRLDLIGPDGGDGTLQEVVSLATALGVDHNLRIIGGVPKPSVPGELDQSDIFLNTTNYESFGVSVMEAAACGLGIVTTSVGELPYLWQHEQEALLVPPDDPAAMAAAVRRLLAEPDLVAKLSRQARQKAEQFDWAVILPQWEELFTHLIKR